MQGKMWSYTSLTSIVNTMVFIARLLIDNAAHQCGMGLIVCMIWLWIYYSYGMPKSQKSQTANLYPCINRIEPKFQQQINHYVNNVVMWYYHPTSGECDRSIFSVSVIFLALLTCTLPQLFTLIISYHIFFRRINCWTKRETWTK